MRGLRKYLTHQVEKNIVVSAGCTGSSQIFGKRPLVRRMRSVIRWQVKLVPNLDYQGKKSLWYTSR